MVAVGAFNQVQSCLRWFVDNFSILADWRATRQRVASFQRAVATMDGLGRFVDRINVEEAQGNSIRIADLAIAGTDSSIKLSETEVEVRPGDRARIVGELSAGRTLLMNAIMGIRPWGGGSITCPPR